MIKRNGIYFPDVWGKIGKSSKDMQRGVRKPRSEPHKFEYVRLESTIQRDAAAMLTEQYNAQAKRWTT